MSSVPHRPPQRRRAVLTCVECRKRKQKCSRGDPCLQCVARGPQSICTYDRHPSSINVSTLKPSPLSEKPRVDDPDAPALMRHAHDYGYSNTDSLHSMGILTKVVTDISNSDISSSKNPGATSHLQNKVRLEYYGYVRRLPSRSFCEIIFEFFFTHSNTLLPSLDEIIFREQLEQWWSAAYEILIKHGPEKLPKDLQCFPALIFQVLAVALQMLPLTYDSRLDELKFGPSQTITELSKEYTDCGVELSKLIGKGNLSLVGIQHSFMRTQWLVNAGDLMTAWHYSGETVRLAMAIGLHLEPEIPSSSRPEELLDVLWINELRKRIWLNLFCWDSCMALALGQPMFINLEECTVTAPIECETPTDRLKRVPVARAETDKPIPLTERLWRRKLSLRFHEIRALEAEGPIPRSPEKVKELHYAAVNFRKSLPPFYQITNTDTSWDIKCPYLVTHRALLAWLVESFLTTLHRPYVFTREQSQLQVYRSSLASLDSQDRWFALIQNQNPQWLIGLTFPTFDAAALLAVVLVSNPERYSANFSRPFQSLKNAQERLATIGSTMVLAKAGAEILQVVLSRVIEAQERKGNPVSAANGLSPSLPPLPSQAATPPGPHQNSSSSSSDGGEPWQFEVDSSAMDWTIQNPDFSEFDFSNLQVPMPLKELLMDEEMAALSGEISYDYDPSLWAQPQGMDSISGVPGNQEEVIDGGDNSLWNFLTDTKLYYS